MLLVIKELIKFLSILIIATFATFVLLYDSPENIAENILIMHDIIPTKDAVEGLIKEHKLDKPFLMQYFHWLISVSNAELGYSHSLDKLVIEEFMDRAPSTFMLAGYSIFFVITMSFSFGIISSVYKNRLIDRIITILSSIVISVPVFWMGLLLILLFVVKLNMFELTKMNEAKNIILPAIALSLPLIGRYAVLIRASFLEQFSSDYVVGAKVRGISQRGIIFGHIFPNAIVAILPPLGISVGAILGGTIIIEMIYGIHGLGSMVLVGITHNDYPLIKSFVLFMTIVYMFISFFVDWICKVIDPRLRHKQ